MKKKSSVSFGPGAASLLLIFVVLAMSVLGMLSLMNSRNDIRLSERSVAVMEAVYQLNAKAEETRAKLDAMLYALSQKAENNESYLSSVQEALADQATVHDNRISWNESDGFRTIHCALEVLPLGSGERTRWVRHTLIVTTSEQEPGQSLSGFEFDDGDWSDYEIDDMDDESVDMGEVWIDD